MKNYKNICFLKINGEYKNLEDKIILDKTQIYGDIIEIKLTEITKITNLDSMFRGCRQLLRLPDFYKLNKNKITHINSLFSECKSLEYLPNNLYFKYY